MSTAPTIGTSGGNAAVSGITIGTSAGNKPVSAAFLGTANGNVQVYSSAPAEDFQVAISPASVSASIPRGTNFEQSYTASYSGTGAPGSYSWTTYDSKQSFNANTGELTIQAGNTAGTFTYRLTVTGTDQNSGYQASATATITLTVT